MYNKFMKILAILFFMPVIAFAGGGSISLDNDMFYHTDRDYTHGTKLTHWNNTVPSFFDKLFEDREKRATYILAQYMYTSTNIAIEELMEGDRPYGGWLYLGYSLQASTQFRHDSFEIDVGVTGKSSGAGETQAFIHDIFNAREPLGWGNQLDEEVGVNLIWQEKLKYKFSDYIEIIPNYGMSVGTIHTFANGGFMLRAGYNLPEDFGPLMMEPVNRTLSNWHFYTFVGADGRYVARNFFLEGSLFEDSSYSVEKEDFVGGLRAGASLGIRSFEIIYAYTIRSKEHETQEDHNEFGSLILSWEY